MSETKSPRVVLIPWDHESTEHVERMYLQRLSCGWRSEEVRGKWVDLGQEGLKTLYWIVFQDDFPQREELIAQHIAANPQESAPIKDTATSHWSVDRQQTTQPLHPIGHISLDRRPSQNEQLNLPYQSSIVWVAGLYVSHALQASGLGLETMHHAERIAASPPLSAEWIVLDTMTREQQMSERFLQRLYIAQGKRVPRIATQDWYERQGYEVFAREDGGYKWASPVTGEREDIDYLFLKKRLVPQ